MPAVLQAVPGDDFTVYAYCNDGADGGRTHNNNSDNVYRPYRPDFSGLVFQFQTFCESENISGGKGWCGMILNTLQMVLGGIFID